MDNPIVGTEIYVIIGTVGGLLGLITAFLTWGTRIITRTEFDDRFKTIDEAIKELKSDFDSQISDVQFELGDKIDALELTIRDMAKDNNNGEDSDD